LVPTGTRQFFTSQHLFLEAQTDTPLKRRRRFSYSTPLRLIDQSFISKFVSSQYLNVAFFLFFLIFSKNLALVGWFFQ